MSQDQFKDFVEKNRLRIKRTGTESVVLGKFGELADVGDEQAERHRLRLLAAPRGENMDRTLRSRCARALAGGLEIKVKGEAESIFYFDPANPAHVDLVIELVGAHRRRVSTMTPEQRQAARDRLETVREGRKAA
jgi:hypothetical protein